MIPLTHRPTLAQRLRTLASLADQFPADVISVHDGGTTVILTNAISAARWREAFDRAPELDGDVRLLEPVGRVS